MSENNQFNGAETHSQVPAPFGDKNQAPISAKTLTDKPSLEQAVNGAVGGPASPAQGQTASQANAETPAQPFQGKDPNSYAELGDDLQVEMSLTIRSREGAIVEIHNRLLLAMALHPSLLTDSMNQLETVLSRLLVGPARIKFNAFVYSRKQAEAGKDEMSAEAKRHDTPGLPLSPFAGLREADSIADPPIILKRPPGPLMPDVVYPMDNHRLTSGPQ